MNVDFVWWEILTLILLLLECEVKYDGMRKVLMVGIKGAQAVCLGSLREERIHIAAESNEYDMIAGNDVSSPCLSTGLALVGGEKEMSWHPGRQSISNAAKTRP